MDETVENVTVPSSSELEVVSYEKVEVGPSPVKRRKISEIREKSLEKLEHRLGGILCCAVCLDLPQAAVYQCSNGHLMCAPCFTHLLADAHIRDESATCPNCRIEISKGTVSRNLAVEKTVSELPSDCKFCSGVFPRHSLSYHEEKTCEERVYKFSQIVVDSTARRVSLVDGLVRIVSIVYSLLMKTIRRTYFVSEIPDADGIKRHRRFRRLTGCRYAVIGCGWRGPAHEAAPHEKDCAHLNKLAVDVVDIVEEREKRAAQEMTIYKQIVDLLSYEKITFNDLQLRPYRTEEFVHKLYYETSRFSAFSHNFVVKAFVNNNQQDPTQTNERVLTYQLILKSKPTSPLALQWVLAAGPHGTMRLDARIASFVFATDTLQAPALPLPLANPEDTNHLLADKPIHFRLIMFLSLK